MTPSNSYANLQILSVDRLLDMTGVLAGQQHCVAPSSHTHAIAKLATGRSGRSGRSGKGSYQISTTTFARGDRADA